MQISFAALSCSNLAAHSLLQPCGLCVFRMQIRFLALSCSCSLMLQTVAACLLQTAAACLLQIVAVN